MKNNKMIKGLLFISFAVLMQACEAPVPDEKLQKMKAEGLAFLKDNQKKPGVQVTPSGLQYEVLTQGEGPNPESSDTVEVHYSGTLIDGEEFDSSYKRGETLSFPLNRVIKGWTEGLQLMNTGSKYRLTIPYDLAYGERGKGGIPPYATLVFEVELIAIK